MADQPGNSSQEESSSAQGRCINVSVKTPNVELSTSLQNVPLSTTIRELKQMIRENAPTQPAENRQRLIFHGRPLLRDEQALVDALGENMIRDLETVTIHMALRDPPEGNPPNMTPMGHPGANIGVAPQRPSETQSQPHPHPQQGHHPLHQHRIRPGGPLLPGQLHAHPGSPLAMPNASTMAQAQQQQRQLMANWANQLHRESQYRHMLAHNHQHRAAMGVNGLAGNATGASTDNPLGAEHTRGRSSPGLQHQTRTVVREGVSPDGRRWRIVNTDGSAANRPAGSPLTANEVQSILRNADASQAANAMRRSASNTSLPAQVGVTTPLLPGSRPLSRTATPDPAIRTPSYGSSSAVPGSQTHALQNQPIQNPGVPEVYILSSPQGPRALLINGNADAYFTPTIHQLTHMLPPNPFLQVPYNPRPFAPTPTVAAPQQPRQRNQTQHGQVPGNRDRHIDIQRPRNVHQNPGAAGAAAVLAGIWPHVWLLIRLGLFLWWFTGPTTSWARWLALVAVAATVFLINTGLLNGFADQAWGPVRRHIENLVPLNGGENPAMQAPGQAAAAPEQGNNRNAPNAPPDPAAIAQRLVDEHRQANNHWLQDVFRRVERAGLLFLASFAPGVAERHIRDLEREQERVEQERRRAEAAAAEAANEENSGENTNQAEQPANPADTADANVAPADHVPEAAQQQAGNLI